MKWLENEYTTSIWVSLNEDLHEGVHREVALGPKDSLVYDGWTRNPKPWRI